MNITNQLSKIPSNLPGNSKVWIYQANRAFNAQELLEINEQLEHFYLQWHVHGNPVTGWAGVLFDHFILFVADESSEVISGCSVDSTTNLLKSLERQYNIQLFDRMTLTFLVKEKVEMLPFNQLNYALEKGYIEQETLVFNNLVNRLSDLKDSWLIPLNQSWAKNHLALS